MASSKAYLERKMRKVPEWRSNLFRKPTGMWIWRKQVFRDRCQHGLYFGVHLWGKWWKPRACHLSKEIATKWMRYAVELIRCASTAYRIFEFGFLLEPQKQHRNDRVHLFLLLQIPRWVAMVSKVSPSCVKAVPSRATSSSVSLQASALATAVMEAVNSQGFTRDSPPLPFYERHNEMCMSAAVFITIKGFEYQLLSWCFS